MTNYEYQIKQLISDKTLKALARIVGENIDFTDIHIEEMRTPLLTFRHINVIGKSARRKMKNITRVKYPACAKSFKRYKVYYYGQNI